MDRGPLILIVVLALGAGGYFLWDAQQSKQATRPGGVAVSPGVPPAGATILPAESTPEAEVSAVLSVRGADARRAAADQYVGQWLPAGGWRGTVERVTQEGEQTALRIRYNASAMVGGEFWVVVVVDQNRQDVKPANMIDFRGRIDEFEANFAGPVPNIRIVVRDADVLHVHGR